jgi:hypothetical protein
MNTMTRQTATFQLGFAWSRVEAGSHAQSWRQILHCCTDQSDPSAEQKEKASVKQQAGAFLPLNKRQ